MRRLLILPAFALAAASFGLSVGDMAPALKVATVVKGNSVDLSHGIHVVEFWATWCGPCKQSIPHLTELAKKYAGKADFTGVSVWENGDDQLGQVKKFVDGMGDKMAYNVDFDGESKTMATTWMQAAHQNGIPAAFLIKDGQILWIGHPMAGLDEAVGQVIDGKFDLATAKAQAAKQEEEAKKQEELQAQLMPFSKAMQAKDYPTALKELDSVCAKNPELKTQAGMVRFNLLALTGSPELGSEADKAVIKYKAQPQMLNSMAWMMVDPKSKIAKPNYRVALKLAKAAAEDSKMKDPTILDTYALALYKAGDKKQALAVQTTAMDLSKSAKLDEATTKDMESRLAMYKSGK